MTNIGEHHYTLSHTTLRVQVYYKLNRGSDCALLLFHRPSTEKWAVTKGKWLIHLNKKPHQQTRKVISDN